MGVLARVALVAAGVVVLLAAPARAATKVAKGAAADGNSTDSDVTFVKGGVPDYAQALGWNFLYYDAARSGNLPSSNRIAWRGDSSLKDGTEFENGTKWDLSGGFHDAGDHLKITMPLSVTLAQLAWSMVEFKDEYKAAGEWDAALDTLKWGTDWLLKAAAGKDQLVVQVGSGKQDHGFLGPPERLAMERPVLVADAMRPASDVASDVAAALAATSIVFKGEGEEAYADRLVKAAKRQYKFAVKHPGRASEWMPAYDAKLYNSSHEEDDMMWAAAWLFKATGDRQYYDDARTLFAAAQEFAKWWPVFNWDNVFWGAVLLMQGIERDMGKEPNDAYQRLLASFFSSWMDGDRKAGIAYTEEDYACIDMWGVNRNTINAASLALLYAHNPADAEWGRNATCWAQSQVDFALGLNPRNQSYVVGWRGGKDGRGSYPDQPHFRAAACQDYADEDEYPCDKANFNSRKPSPHVLRGAMVFGKCATYFVNNRSDAETNEVALDGNAGLAVALAALSDEANRCKGEPFVAPAKRPPPPEGNGAAAGMRGAAAAGASVAMAVVVGTMLVLAS